MTLIESADVDIGDHFRDVRASVGRKDLFVQQARGIVQVIGSYSASDVQRGGRAHVGELEPIAMQLMTSETDYVTGRKAGSARLAPGHFCSADFLNKKLNPFQKHLSHHFYIASG